MRASLNRIFILLVTFFLLFSKIGWAASYYIVQSSGNSVIRTDTSKYKKIKGRRAICNGSVIKTGRDSYVVLKTANHYIKLYSFSMASVHKKVRLIYGKMVTANGMKFKQSHFTIWPLPAQGATTRIVLWGDRFKSCPHVHIVDEKGLIKKSTFFQIDQNRFRAIIGFDVTQRQKRYRMEITGNFSDQTAVQIIYPFYLKGGKFGKGDVYLKKDEVILFKPSIQKKEEQRLLASILYKISETQYWEHNFIYPVRNPHILSGFGKKRLYHIPSIRSFYRIHWGVDFSGELNDPVYAPNSGTVVFSGKRITTGNTVVIDHGQGVFSLFFHMNNRYVNEGNFVKKGAKIGSIGKTGIAEGTHLHWGLFITNCYVNPIQWITTDF